MSNEVKSGFSIFIDMRNSTNLNDKTEYYKNFYTKITDVANDFEWN